MTRLGLATQGLSLTVNALFCLVSLKRKKIHRKVNEETVSGCPRCDEFVIKWQLSQSTNKKDNMLANWVYMIFFFRSQTFWMVTNI